MISESQKILCRSDDIGIRIHLAPFLPGRHFLGAGLIQDQSSWYLDLLWDELALLLDILERELQRSPTKFVCRLIDVAHRRRKELIEATVAEANQVNVVRDDHSQLLNRPINTQCNRKRHGKDDFRQFPRLVECHETSVASSFIRTKLAC